MSCFLIHNHTEMSNLRISDCNIKVEKLIDRAVELKLAGIAITDHECISGHIRAIQKAKELRDRGIDLTIGLGNEIYLVNSLETVKDNYTSGVTKFPHFILVAKDKRGHEALRKLSSHAWGNNFRTGKMERTVTTTQFLSEIMYEYKGHLIATSACLGGYVGIKYREYSLTQNPYYMQEINTFLNACKYLFNDDFYLELQPSYMNEQIEYNKFLIEKSNELNIKTIYATDTHYLSLQHKQIHKALLTSGEGDREVDDFYSSTYMMDKEEIWEYFKNYISLDYFEYMTSNTLEICNKIEFYDLFMETQVPQITIPPFNDNYELKKYLSQYEFINKFYNSEYLIDKYLLFLINKGLKDKNQKYDTTNLDRIEEELKQLWLISEKINQRLSSYYCFTKDLVDIMWMYSLVGIARGSVTGFYVAYLIDITQMNPIQFNLPSWRHIHSSKAELADIDLDSSACYRQDIFNAIIDKYGADNTLNVSTFKTLKPKLAIQTAGRGLGFNNDEIMAISDIIPIERGQQWSLNDCLYGNEEEDRKPIKEFISIINEYPNLLDTALDLEGLIVGRSIHASGLIVFPNGYILQNSRMKAPNGTDITCWNLSDSEYCGGLKMDCLTIEALDKIQICMAILVQKGLMEWKGSLRDTYNYYLHPDKINYDNFEMWNLLYQGHVTHAFQYEGSVGTQALQKIQPHNFLELVTGNSLMRLANKGGEQPLDKYVRFKNDISLWYKEMQDYGLNENEISILEPHLSKLYGIADTQEVVMELSMDKGIANFTLTEANKLRKGISKKNKKTIESSKKLFFEKGLENGTSNAMLQYVWDIQITPSLGYSFSKNHTNPYTGILLQEMNLAYKYGHMYWKNACLTVSAGAIGDSKSTNYGKIAKAISEMNDIVDKPNINISESGFTIQDDKILFGLKAIEEVGANDIELIMNNRPFSSFQDFLQKCESISKNAVINLIKSGALDGFGQRENLMKEYITSITEFKDTFTMANINVLLEKELLSDDYKQEIEYYNLYKAICNKPRLIPKDPTLKGEWYKIDNQLFETFSLTFDELIEDKDYFFHSVFNCYIIHKSRFKKVFDKKIERMLLLLKDKEILDTYNNLIFQENWDKYAVGNIAKWEMDSMNYYKTAHELSYVNTTEYHIENFFDLPEDPIVNDIGIYRGKEFKRYGLSLIMGTVLDRDKTKHTVSLLTPQGVVTCKLYDGAFNHYNKTISKIESSGKKKRIEESWFKRGNLLLVYGFRMGEQFKPRKYKNSIYQHSIMKIIKVEHDGSIVVQQERTSV